jgi:endonuclease YncB( thermonuclease family)
MESPRETLKKVSSLKRMSSGSLKKSSSHKKSSSGDFNVKKIKKKLEEIDTDSVPSVPYQNKVVYAKICGVYDGDTCTFVVLIGGKVPIKLNARIEGIDTPEIRGSSPLEKEAAIAVRDEVTRLIEGKILPIKMLKWDKYGGRVDAQIFIEEGGLLSNYLIDKMLAKPYDGGRKEPWQTEELTLILDILRKNEGQHVLLKNSNSNE